MFPLLFNMIFLYGFSLFWFFDFSVQIFYASLYIFVIDQKKKGSPLWSSFFFLVKVWSSFKMGFFFVVGLPFFSWRVTQVKVRLLTKKKKVKVRLRILILTKKKRLRILTKKKGYVLKTKFLCHSWNRTLHVLLCHNINFILIPLQKGTTNYAGFSSPYIELFFFFRFVNKRLSQVMYILF